MKKENKSSEEFSCYSLTVEEVLSIEMFPLHKITVVH